MNDDPMKTTLTLKRTIGALTVTAKGILEPTRTGHRVRVTLYRSRSGRFVAVSSKTVRVKQLRDRDGDGKTDGTYLASFTRPTAGGSYKLTARFLGTSTHKASSRSVRFRLGPR